jgi:hypothetical protein
MNTSKLIKVSPIFSSQKKKKERRKEILQRWCCEPLNAALNYKYLVLCLL